MSPQGGKVRSAQKTLRLCIRIVLTRLLSVPIFSRKAKGDATMQIDSARELKALCLKQHVKPLAASPLKLSALAVGARSIAKVDPTQRTIALGIAQKGKGAYHLAVRIQTRALENSPQLEAIRQKAKGEVDIRYIGRVTKRAAPWNQSRERPLLIGVSIGHYRITAGTLGCFAKTRNTSDPRILSNNHVLADENQGRKGDAVVQPGRYDKGKRGKDTAGALDKFVRLNANSANFVDCALATIKKGIRFDQTTLTGMGQLKGVANSIPDVGALVHKIGRTTGQTNGRVTAFEVDNVIIGYDIGNLRFDNQIEIEGADDGPFSQGGDSGSLVFDDNWNAVSLLFAGGDQGGSNGQGLTYANPIGRVFDELDVDLLS
jgi:hypothetical protein